MTKKEQQTHEKSSQDGDRKPYVKPTLTAYGNVKEFTRGGGGSSADKIGPQAG